MFKCKRLIWGQNHGSECIGYSLRQSANKERDFSPTDTTLRCQGPSEDISSVIITVNVSEHTHITLYTLEMALSIMQCNTQSRAPNSTVLQAEPTVCSDCGHRQPTVYRMWLQAEPTVCSEHRMWLQAEPTVCSEHRLWLQASHCM